jgi:hypothetical protein
MSVSPFPTRGNVLFDRRDVGRSIRVAAHPDAGLVTISVWRDDTCIATHQLSPADAAELVAVLADAIAACTGPASAQGSVLEEAGP